MTIMKSTFKADYRRIENADGTVSISFQDELISATSFAMIAAFSAIAIFVVSIMLAIVFSMMKHTGNPSMTQVLLIFAVLSFSVLRLTKRRVVLNITPRVGIAWARHRLPFADISLIELSTVTFGGGGQAYIYALVGGSEIKITRYMPVPRAQAIHEEIVRLSGR
jgi:hypothetical protein